MTKSSKPITSKSLCARQAIHLMRDFLVNDEIIRKFKADADSGKFQSEEALEREKSWIIQNSLR